MTGWWEQATVDFNHPGGLRAPPLVVEGGEFLFFPVEENGLITRELAERRR